MRVIGGALVVAMLIVLTVFFVRLHDTQVSAANTHQREVQNVTYALVLTCINRLDNAPGNPPGSSLAIERYCLTHG